MKRRIISMLLVLVMLVGIMPMAMADDVEPGFAYRACEHATSYKRQEDSYEATDTTGGYRHYKCSECNAEYSYKTDPMVYEVNPKTGEEITFDYAINPYLPNWEFIPDNEMHVLWSREDSEWRVYVLGSHDTKMSGWCGNDVPVWSAPVYDLTDWRFECSARSNPNGKSYFACDFDFDVSTDQVIFYAHPRGSLADDGNIELWLNGHSVPDVPFDIPLCEDGVDGVDGMNYFDPAIYIDEDGNILTAYTVNRGSPRHTQLMKINDDRTGLDWTVPVQIFEGEYNTQGYDPKHFEGSTIDYLAEYDIWVLQYVYASNNDPAEKNVDGETNWWPLVYLYSEPGLSLDDLETAKWHYGGVIADNGGFYRKDAGSDEITDHEDPVYSWGNNHGGLVKINGEWYVSSHRHTSTGAGRQSYIQKVSMSYQDGKLVINPTEYTSSIGESIDAYHTWPASIACHLLPTNFSERKGRTLYIENPLSGPLSTTEYWNTIYDNPEYAEHRSPIVGIVNGAEVGFKYLNFGEEATNVDLTVLVSGEEGYVDGVMNVYLDAPSAEEGGTLIGSIDVNAAAMAAAGVSATDSKGVEWSKLSGAMDQAVSGIHGVYFVFSSEQEGTICKLDEFTFSDRDHEHAYRLVRDSYEATDTTGGYRHYACETCGEEYSYTTDPMVYEVNPKTGAEITLDTAINPYLPNWEFMPDNELHVFWSREDSEWRVYAVGSHDTKLSGWCGPDITCWSAPVYDLTDWRFEAILRDTGTFFACDFNYDLQTDQAVLYAFPFFGNPEMNGTHLWVNGNSVPDSYFGTPLVEGAGVVGLDGKNLFDPSLYIAEDGTMLATYDSSNGGAKHAQLAKVNANDRTKVEWTLDVKMAEGERNTNGFNPKHYEGSTIDLVEVDGHTFWVIQYSYQSNWSNSDYEKDVNGEKRWWPLAYVYSDPDMTIDELKDFEGWHWGGIIGDNGGFFRQDLETGEVVEHDTPVTNWGNNHGGLAYINGQWVVSNHRHTSTGAGRQGYIRTVDIYVDEAGKLVIETPEYTSSIGDSIDAYHPWSAYIACHLWPSVFSEAGNKTMYIDNPMRVITKNYWETVYATPELAEHLSPVVGIFDGAEVGFKYLNFGETKQALELSMLVAKKEGYVDGAVDVYIDAINTESGGTKLGTIDLSNAAVAAADVEVTSVDGMEWRRVSAEMDVAVSGVHAVYFVFNSEAEGTICKFDEFDFNGTPMADVTLEVTGETDVTVDDEELTYTVSAKGAEDLVTATIVMDLDETYLAEPVVEALNGFYVIAETYENGKLTVVLGNNAGLTGDGDLMSVTVKSAGKVGKAEVAITDAVLSVYLGQGESYVEAILGEAFVTEIDYSVYDVNEDGTVDQLDITRAQRFFGAADAKADVNDDNIVDINDLILILNNYSK